MRDRLQSGLVSDELSPYGGTPCARCGCPYRPWPEVDWDGSDDGPMRFYACCRHCLAVTASYDDEAEAQEAWTRGETKIPGGIEPMIRWLPREPLRH